MLRTNRHLLPAGFAVTTLVMLLVTAMGFRALRHARESILSVAHAQQVLKALEDVLGSTVDAEMATRACLAIVRHLVELHGGSVRAESGGVGEGATFRVLLPLTIGRHDATDPTSLTEPAFDLADLQSSEF